MDIVTGVTREHIGDGWKVKHEFRTGIWVGWNDDGTMKVLDITPEKPHEQRLDQPVVER